MNGWHRFGILIVCCVAVMILFPEYNFSGWSFMGMMLLMWTGVIVLLSLLINIFGLERAERFNKLLTLVIMVLILWCLLLYFPQTDKVSPINKLKYGEYPTKRTIKKGIKKLTFNFDFKRRNVHRDANYINQEATPYFGSIKKTKETIKRVQDRANEAINYTGEVLSEE